MKTKKDILKWWEDLGKITKHINDFEAFKNAPKDFTYNVIEDNWNEIHPNEPNNKIVKIMRNNWKYSLKLVFSGNECIRIIGF